VIDNAAVVTMAALAYNSRVLMVSSSTNVKSLRPLAPRRGHPARDRYDRRIDKQQHRPERFERRRRSRPEHERQCAGVRLCVTNDGIPDEPTEVLLDAAGGEDALDQRIVARVRRDDRHLDQQPGVFDTGSRDIAKLHGRRLTLGQGPKPVKANTGLRVR
jgi:hypothetical protein